MINVQELLTALCDNEVIQDLLKAEYEVESTDPDCLIFKNDNSELKIKSTDNSLSYSLTYKSEDDIRTKFTKVCDKIDDEIFEEACELYTAANGEGSLNELNKTMDPESAKEFLNYISQICHNRIDECWKYITIINNAGF